MVFFLITYYKSICRIIWIKALIVNSSFYIYKKNFFSKSTIYEKTEGSCTSKWFFFRFFLSFNRLPFQKSKNFVVILTYYYSRKKIKHIIWACIGCFSFFLIWKDITVLWGLLCGKFVYTRWWDTIYYDAFNIILFGFLFIYYCY